MVKWRVLDKWGVLVLVKWRVLEMADARTDD